MVVTKFIVGRNLRKSLRNLARQIENEEPLIGVTFYHDGGMYRFTSICRRIPAFACEKLGIVVKRPKLIIVPNTPLKWRVPTIKLNDEGWVVQPLVDVSEAKRACRILERKMNWFCDLHDENVGFWKNRAVLFDW